MPNPRKFILAKSLYFVTFRTEEGLPFVPTEAINELVWAALGRAQELYPVTPCGFSWEANHTHFALLAQNPEDVSRFVGYVKQESAHAINRLLGRRKKTVWAEGFDSPAILDSHKALEILVYILLNPVKDNLVEKMDDYPGVSGWKFFKNKIFKRPCLRIHRDSIPVLDDPTRPHLETKKVLRILQKNSKSKINFRISPYAWKECFPDTANLSDEVIHDMMMDRIEQKESEIRNEKNRTPIGKNNLITQSIIKPYQPKTFGKRMICLSSIAALRKRFIHYYKYLCNMAIEVYQRWKKGDFSLPFPSGLFPPSKPRASNLIPDLFAV